MEFRILGSVEVVDDGGFPIALGPAKQRALLAILLLHLNEVVSRNRLIEDLWGERMPESAATALHGYVSQLRKVLESRDRSEHRVLITHAPGYLLELDPGQLDLKRFELLTRRGKRELAAGDANAAAATFAEALSLWRGPPLAEFGSAPFALAESLRLQELMVSTLEDRIEADLALGRHDELTSELRTLVGEHPFRERLCDQLMRALYRCGRQAEALEAYRNTRRKLVEELGIEPGPALQQLEKAILVHDPSLDMSAPAPVMSEVTAYASVLPVAEPQRAQRKLVTLLSAGISSSNQQDESIDPEALRALHSASRDSLRVAAERHGGVVDDPGAGAAMAVFGVPVVREDDALRALRAALELRHIFAELGLEGTVGINSGEVLTGTSERLVIGHAVTAAERLRQAAQPGEILVGKHTMQLACGAVTAEPLEGEPTLAWRLISVSPVRPRRRFDSPFVGREHELHTLTEMWERVQGEQGCDLVTVIGAAGVGKSRLVAELLARVDASVALGRCLSYGAGITYWPVVEVLSQLRPAWDELEPAVARPLRALLDDDAAATTGELAWAFRKLVEAVARARALMLVFDDVQWAEPALLDLIEHLVVISKGAPILVLCTARPELLEQRPGWRGLLRLEPLTPQAADQLARACIHDRERDGAVAQRVVEAAAGNPLFIEELAAMLDETGDHHQHIPPTIQALLSTRLDQLDVAERSVLEAAAVVGEVFHVGDLQALVPEQHQFAMLLTTLVRKEFVRPDESALEGEDAFRFHHLLLRDATYDAIPKAIRSSLHERYADWIAQGGDAQDAFVGYHLEQACRYRSELDRSDSETGALGERAATHLAAAGRRAIERGDYRAGTNLVERALAVGLADPQQRASSQLVLVHYLGLLGRPTEREALLAEVFDTATRLGDSALIVRAHLRDAPNMIGDPKSDLEQPRRIIEEAFETLSELDDQPVIAWELAYLHQLDADICGRKGHMAERLAHLERLLAAWEAIGSRGGRRAATGFIASTLCQGPVLVGDAIRRCEGLILKDPSDRALEAIVTGRMSALVAMAGRAEEALALAERSSLGLGELGIILPTLVTRDAVAEAKEYAGDRAGATEEREATQRKFEEIYTGRPNARAISAAYKLALLYCDESRWEDAERQLAYGPELPVPVHFRQEAALRLAGRARVAAHNGRHGEAVGLATKAAELADQSDMLNLRGRLWETHAEVHSAAGDSTEANASLAKALLLYQQKGNLAAAERLRSTVRA